VRGITVNTRSLALTNKQKTPIFRSQISGTNAACHPIYLASAFSVRQIGQRASAIFPLNEYNHLTLKLFCVLRGRATRVAFVHVYTCKYIYKFMCTAYRGGGGGGGMSGPVWRVYGIRGMLSRALSPNTERENQYPVLYF